MGKRKTTSDDADPTPYAVPTFAKRHGLSEHAAKVVIAANGPSRVACDAAARAFVAALTERKRATVVPGCNSNARVG